MTRSGAMALWNQLYDLKFSKHVPLFVILLSGVYAIYRSTHYLMSAFHLLVWVAAPTALFIELLVLGSGALVFISQRHAFIAELENKDKDLAGVGVWTSLTLLGVSFAALIGIAWADAMLMTNQGQAAALMTLAQIAQSGMIIVFVIIALLDEREDLRTEHADLTRRSCPWCAIVVTPNNRKRHMAVCPKKPSAQ